MEQSEEKLVRKEKRGRGWQSLLATEGTLDCIYVMIEFISV